jgi:hypothetical protein
MERMLHFGLPLSKKILGLVGLLLFFSNRPDFPVSTHEPMFHQARGFFRRAAELDSIGGIPPFHDEPSKNWQRRRVLMAFRWPVPLPGLLRD